MGVDIKYRGLDAKKITDQMLTDKVRLFAHKELHRLYTRYVPYDRGFLTDNVEFTPEHVRHTQNYSHRQYHGGAFNFRKDKHPLATAKWAEVAMQTQKEKLIRAIANEIRGGKTNG